MNPNPSNAQISKARGKTWKKNLISGRLKASVDPSVLRITRVGLGLNQSIVSEKLGLSLNTYVAIEGGNRMVSSERAAEIAKFFRLKPVALFIPAEDQKFLAKKRKSHEP